METLVDLILNSYLVVVALYFIGVNLTYTVLLAISVREIINHMRHDRFSNYRLIVQSELTPPVPILAPAYNEEATVIQSVKSLLRLAYGKYEVVVINDGSKHKTLAQLTAEFEMH